MANCEINPAMRGKQFKPGQSGNPKGRPKNRVHEWIAEATGRSITRVRRMEHLSKSEAETIERFLIGATLEDLKAVVKSSAAPMYLKCYASAIMFDGKNGRTATIDRLRDRLFGATTQNVSFTFGRRLEDMTDEELQAELERLDDNGED